VTPGDGVSAAGRTALDRVIGVADVPDVPGVPKLPTGIPGFDHVTMGG